MALENQEVMQEIANLKFMLWDKQIMNPTQTNKVLGENEAKYENLVDRARIRWGLYGDG